MPISVCSVCTGSICRSPMAGSVFRARVEDAGLDGAVAVDSARTGGRHEGDGADPRAVTVLRESGYASGHSARRFQPSRFPRLDLVTALDEGHLRELRRPRRTPAKVRLLRSYGPAAGGDLDVPDPYHGGTDGFEECPGMVEAASGGLLAAVREALEERAA
ncbi:low molecular weight protein-tyrosine-phosphatase [Streptomyces sp. NPDC049910]|uniref:low molecular weight protein-tyrosine-phosphatase n=1 Tax=Streptomyces sp. NPDC049910 TaxID=3155278 RepID=UPI0034126074